MDQKTQKTLFSSNSKDWTTPPGFYENLNKIYKFTLDPCSSKLNHKCDKYFTIEDDGLNKSWKGETVFMNPPYGREINKWIRKAAEEGQKKGTIVVCLIPARTDTKYWHDCCMKAHEIYFVKGRLKFFDSATKLAKNSAPFPSAVVVFKSGHTAVYSGNYPKIYSMNIKKETRKTDEKK